MMDFEQMGTMMGAKAAINNVVADAHELVASKDAEIARLKSALAVEQMHTAGLAAQALALKAALERADPNNALLKKTGRVFPDGKPQVGLSLVYSKAFDDEGARRNIPQPNRFRKVAK